MNTYKYLWVISFEFQTTLVAILFAIRGLENKFTEMHKSFNNLKDEVRKVRFVIRFHQFVWYTYWYLTYVWTMSFLFQIRKEQKKQDGIVENCENVSEPLVRSDNIH